MKRSGFKPKHPPKPAKQMDGYTPKPREVECRISDGRARLTVAIPKTAGRVVQAIRDSARGEECSVRIIGACSHDPEKTIWSHAPMQAAGKGRGIKALDVAGAYCCTSCDSVIDRQTPLPPGVTYEQALLDWHAGHMRSLVILNRKGLV